MLTHVEPATPSQNSFKSTDAALRDSIVASLNTNVNNISVDFATGGSGTNLSLILDTGAACNLIGLEAVDVSGFWIRFPVFFRVSVCLWTGFLGKYWSDLYETFTIERSWPEDDPIKFWY